MVSKSKEGTQSIKARDVHSGRWVIHRRTEQKRNILRILGARFFTVVKGVTNVERKKN